MNRMVLVVGRTRGATDFVRAVDAGGRVMWQVDVCSGGQSGPFPTTTARFTPDGNTAYFGTMIDNKVCDLYAIDTGPVHKAEVWTYGRACRGISTKLPGLGFSNRPVLGSVFAAELTDARANATAVHVLGFAPMRQAFDSLGAPGCTGYVRPDVAIVSMTDALGRANSSLVVPRDSTLAGLKLFHQFAVADPVNPLGVVATVGGVSQLGL